MRDTSNWQFQLAQSSDQMMTGVCSSHIGTNFTFSMVYGFNTASERKRLWSQLLQEASSTSGPWLVIRDFNVGREIHEKIGGRKVSAAVLQDFNRCVDTRGLKELKVDGPTWTWHNSSFTSRRIVGCLDKVLVNQD